MQEHSGRVDRADERRRETARERLAAVSIRASGSVPPARDRAPQLLLDGAPGRRRPRAARRGRLAPRAASPSRAGGSANRRSADFRLRSVSSGRRVRPHVPYYSSVAWERELEVLEEAIRRVNAEYDAFLYGTASRPPGREPQARRSDDPAPVGRHLRRRGRPLPVRDAPGPLHGDDRALGAPPGREGSRAGAPGSTATSPRLPRRPRRRRPGPRAQPPQRARPGLRRSLGGRARSEDRKSVRGVPGRPEGARAKSWTAMPSRSSPKASPASGRA